MANKNRFNIDTPIRDTTGYQEIDIENNDFCLYMVIKTDKYQDEVSNLRGYWMASDISQLVDHALRSPEGKKILNNIYGERGMMDVFIDQQIRDGKLKL